MSKRAKWITFGAVVLGIAGFAGMTAARKGQKPVAVRIEPIEKRDLISSVTASGQVQPRTKVDVASDVTGRIVRLAVKEGQMVTKGQFLLQIDLEQARAQFERTQAAASSAKARMAQARAAWEGMPAMPAAWAADLDRRFNEACRAAEKREERRQRARHIRSQLAAE